MPWTLEMLLPTRAAMLTRLDSASGPPMFRIYRADNGLLATLRLADPAGSVNQDTGLLTLNPGDPGDNPEASGTGTAAYAELMDGESYVLAENIPVGQGSTPVAGTVVLTSTSIVQGGSVELVSAVIG